MSFKNFNNRTGNFQIDLKIYTKMSARRNVQSRFHCFHEHPMIRSKSNMATCLLQFSFPIRSFETRAISVGLSSSKLISMRVAFS